MAQKLTINSMNTQIITKGILLLLYLGGSFQILQKSVLNILRTLNFFQPTEKFAKGDIKIVMFFLHW